MRIASLVSEGFAALINMLESDLEDERNARRQIISGVILHVFRTLMMSPEFDRSLDELVEANRADARSLLAFRLEQRGIIALRGDRERLLGREERIDAAEEALRNITYPYIQQIASNPDASVSDLYDIRPQGM